MINFAIEGMAAAEEACMGDGLAGDGNGAMRSSIGIVARLRTHGRFALRPTWADFPLLVAGELRLLLTEYRAIIRIAFDE